ncbi:type I-E CRISPR-associated protein Cse2/CasB [Streptoverticillium reticulum]|uniref:type I-E CRISPR-associated protein Cse2/CasB n=1 Tax=Streptoverticillium reticulum TaxID=1433415 RepID=UPI0039BF497F
MPWLLEARTFVQAITRISAQDTGTRAALRSGLGKQLDEVPRMHRIVAPLLPARVLGDDEAQRAFYAVAALLATHTTRGSTVQPDKESSAVHASTPADEDTNHRAAEAAPATVDGDAAQEQSVQAAAAARRRYAYGESLGLAFAAAVARGTREGIRESAAETRLNLLTRQSTAGLHRHLPAAVRQLCDKKCPPDWARLLVDLRTWPQDRKRLSRRWLQDFYRARHRDDLAAARTADTTGTTEDDGGA